MDPKLAPRSPIAKRLREARLRTGISQKTLGVKAGIDEFSASARINQYEQDKHVPDYGTARRLAAALGVPATYLYAEDDDLAELICLFAAATKRLRVDVRKTLKTGRL